MKKGLMRCALSRNMKRPTHIVSSKLHLYCVKSQIIYNIIRNWNFRVMQLTWDLCCCIHKNITQLTRQGVSERPEESSSLCIFGDNKVSRLISVRVTYAPSRSSGVGNSAIQKFYNNIVEEIIRAHELKKLFFRIYIFL